MHGTHLVTREGLDDVLADVLRPRVELILTRLVRGACGQVPLPELHARPSASHRRCQPSKQRPPLVIRVPLVVRLVHQVEREDVPLVLHHGPEVDHRLAQGVVVGTLCHSTNEGTA